MLIAILIISIVSLVFSLLGLRETNDRITNLELTLDEIKNKTDMIGTEEGLTYKGDPTP